MAGGRRRNRNSNTVDAFYDDDYLETSSQDSADSSQSSGSRRGRRLEEQDDTRDNPVTLEDKLSSAVDALTEKRATTREGGLHTLCTILTLKCVPELLSSQIVTVVECVKKSVSKPGTEGELAAKALALASLTLGNDANLSVLFPTMRELSRDPAFAVSNRSAILDALSVMLLMEDVLPNTYLEWLSYAESIFSEKKTDASIIRAAVSLWGVVSTEIDPQYIADNLNLYIAAHEKLLAHDSTDVRIAAGENIGVLFELMEDGTNDTVEYDNRAGLIEKLGDLAIDASRHRGKKEGRSQRLAFKEILATVENSDTPTQHLTIRKMDYSLKSWGSLKRLNLIKYYLNEGLSVHLESNEVVQACLSLEVAAEAPERPTGEAKRVQQLIQQRLNKARSKNLSIERDLRSSSRQSIHNHGRPIATGVPVYTG